MLNDFSVHDDQILETELHTDIIIPLTDWSVGRKRFYTLSVWHDKYCLTNNDAKQARITIDAGGWEPNYPAGEPAGMIKEMMDQLNIIMSFFDTAPPRYMCLFYHDEYSETYVKLSVSHTRG